MASSPPLTPTLAVTPALRPTAILRAALLAALVVVMYASPAIALAEEWWENPAASHGMLIPPLVMVVAWMQRSRVQQIAPSPDARGLAAVAAACGLYLLGTAGAEFFLARFSFVLLLGGLIWTFWGRARFRLLFFPLLLLLTMIPIPMIVYNLLASPLQLFASAVATYAAQLAGVAVYRDGNVIHLATVELGVAEACSGLHSLSALAVAGMLLGFLESGTKLVRVALVLSSIPIAILVNVARVAGTAILADYHPEAAMGFYHSFSGWLVFLVAFAALWGTSKLLRNVLHSRS